MLPKFVDKMTLRKWLSRWVTKAKLLFGDISKFFHKVIGRIKKLYRKIKYHARYQYALQTWNNLNRGRKIVGWLKSKFDISVRLGFLIVALGTALLVSVYGGTAFTQDILSNYLVAAGAMLGGTIAIVFTISIFLLQNAADLYSSQFFEAYVHDWKERIVYILVVLITLVFFGGGLYVGGLESISSEVSRNILFVSLFLIGLVFLLIDWQYKKIREKINPINALLFLRKEAGSFLKILHKDAERLAKTFRAKDKKLTQELALASAYNHFLKPYLANLDRQLENLFEISMRLSERHEDATSKRGFSAMHDIIVAFLLLRKDSSIAIPSGIAFLAVESDSQSFLVKTLERFNKAGETFIKGGRTENATYIIDLYKSFGNYSKEINFKNRPRENPVFELIKGYLWGFIEFGKRANDVEVVFQGVKALGYLSRLASAKGYDTVVYGLQENIRDLAYWGISEKQTVVTDAAIAELHALLDALFTSDQIVRRHIFDDIFKSFASISRFIRQAIKTHYLPDNFSTRFLVCKPYDDLYRHIALITNYYDKVQGAREKRAYRSDLAQMFEDFRRSLRDLSEELMECDSLLVGSIGRILFHINELIVLMLQDRSISDIHSELQKCLSWNVYQPYWFIHHTDKFKEATNAFDDLIESVAKTGILAFQRIAGDEIPIAAARSLGDIANASLEKITGGFGFDEPRILEKACYLGILGLKHNRRHIFAEVAVKILDFEPKFRKKYHSNLPPGIDPDKDRVIGIPRRDQLLVELMRWRDDFARESRNGMLRMRDDSEAMMYPLIDESDIDRFIFEVWGIIIGGSAIEQELEEKAKLKLVRKSLIKVLKEVARQK